MLLSTVLNTSQVKTVPIEERVRILYKYRKQLSHFNQILFT